MTRWAAALLTGCLLSGAVMAQSPNPSNASPTAVTSGDRTQAARIGWLDKQTNRRSQVVLQVGQTQTLNGLNVTLTRCAPNLAGRPGLEAAWLEVRAADRSAPWFAGWMFNQFPDAATLDHPRFDLQLVGCGAEAPPLPRAARRLVEPSSAPAVDLETQPVAAAAGDAATDPFAVPGVIDTSVPPTPEISPESPVEGVPVESAPAPDAEAAPVAEAAPAAQEQPGLAPVAGPVAPEPEAQPPVDELQRLIELQTQ